MDTELAIVIPAYKPEFLEAALESIAAQTDSRFRLYVGDDAAPAAVGEICEKYRESANLSYTRFDENLGGKCLVSQWNRCVDLCSEPWIWLFSDDDVMEPECVARFYESMEKHGHEYSLFRFNTMTINEAGEVTVRHSSPLGCETKMVREWLRVSCRTARGGNQILDVNVLEAAGVKKYEIFDFKREGVASLVLPIRHPIEAKIRFLWSQWGARTLTISYPQGAPVPKVQFDRAPPGGATSGSQSTRTSARKPCVYCTNQPQRDEARDRGLPCCAPGIQCAEKLGCISRGICCMR